MEKFAALLFLFSALCESHAETLLKEFRSPQGVAQLLLPPQAPGEAAEAAETLSAEGDTGVASSIRDLDLPGETLLLVYFQDAFSGEEVRFPVRLSQMRRFMRAQSTRHRSGSREERMVSGIRELSRSLKVRMRTEQEMGDSK